MTQDKVSNNSVIYKREKTRLFNKLEAELKKNISQSEYLLKRLNEYRENPDNCCFCQDAIKHEINETLQTLYSLTYIEKESN